MNIIKKAQCGNLSNPNKKTLTYNVGYNSEQFLLRITDNHGGGFHSTEWVSLSSVSEQVTTDKPFSAKILSPLYESKSANNPGFLAAILVAEMLWLPVEDNKRLFTMNDFEDFETAMNKLIEKKVSLKDEVAEREAKKEASRLALEAKFKAQRKKASKVKS